MLVGSGEVGGAIRGEDAGEEAEVVGDALGERGIGCGGEIDGAADGVLLLEELEEFAVVGQVDDIELDGGGDVALESGLALAEPARELQEQRGVLAGEGER